MFGEKLRKIREKRGWTQKQLAEKIGRPENTLWRIQMNMWHPSYAVLKDLVEKAKIKPSELF